MKKPNLFEEIRKWVCLMTCPCCGVEIERVIESRGYQHCYKCKRTFCKQCIRKLAVNFNVTHHGGVCIVDVDKHVDRICQSTLCDGKIKTGISHCDFCIARVWQGYKVNLSPGRPGDFNPKSFDTLYNNIIKSQ